ncbi:NAD(P)-binding protein, partial [Aulographum hederae CBS 113979]
MVSPVATLPMVSLELLPSLEKKINIAVTEKEIPSALLSPPMNNAAQEFAEKHQKRTLALFSLEGRVVVITGGARGIGLTLGQGLITSGASLAIVDIDVEESKRQAANLNALFKERNPDDTSMVKITAHFSNVSDPESVNAAIAEIIAEHGKIDNLVTSAGFTQNFDAVNYNVDAMRRLWRVNVDGTYLFATAVARHLMERHSTGSMVLIGSISGNIINVPQPQTPYNVSKAAVKHMASSLAVEWAQLGIRVNCLSPGYTVTALTEKILAEKPELSNTWITMTPMKRLGKPEDLVGAVAFLLSDASEYVTGTDLKVDGGYT